MPPLEKKRKQGGREEADVNADDEGAGGSGGRKKRKLVKAVETSFSQSKLQVYRGLDIPFSEDHTQAIAQQTLRATQSANLPERWTSGASYDTLHADDPIPFWEMLQVNKAVLPLAKFAQQLLHLVVNQAGQERWFSDFSNKKSKKRNRLSLKKMAQVQQAKVTRFIRQEQKAEGLTDERTKRKNHEDVVYFR
ncbi:hypothetical protein R3P38DRAFT_3193268 [Favolaschia claudopus]|uniref:RRP15-like protein n=1 Tax=Favolaschia claudopus TaxID=2862362 RepID=A0AAW0BI45_9AGAR